MALINTFIFLDLELTGHVKGKDSKPNKITEIGLVAVSRKHIVEKHIQSKQETRHSKSFLPRVINKINCAINPCQELTTMASMISNLTNEDLEDQKPFDETIYLLIFHFMNRFEKPICLVAHDGFRFDFPILQSQLANSGKVLPGDVFCADSLIGFCEVLTLKTAPPTRQNQINGVCIPENCTAQDYEMAKAIANTERLAMDHISGFDSFESMKSKIERHLRQISASRSNVTSSSNPQKFNLKDLYNDLTGKPLKVEHQAEADAEALLECVVAVGLPMLKWIDANRKPFRSMNKMCVQNWTLERIHTWRC